MDDFVKYVLIGAGGTGSNFIAPALAFLNSWHTNQETDWDFLIIDGDNFEAKNQERQLFDPRYIGVNKAEALAYSFSQYPVRALPRFIGIEDMPTIMEEGTVVFLAVDNYSVRSLIEQRAYELSNTVIINAGNEKDTGSVQLWVREGGQNKTPPLSYLHPEIKYLKEDDRSGMTCMEVAQMPGGEQLVVANLAAAQHMLTALWRYHGGTWQTGWTELQFDLKSGSTEPINLRENRNWELDRPVEIFVGALPESM